ncbi:MAG: hypothetical protein IT230_10025 [Flavobacteriales bacterium]|nr:hypothetical protein [Flavobacteriales bacterium]
MKTRYILAMAMVAPALYGMGQCPFTPTITPAILVLCPNGSATLSTESYEAYQWYKDGTLIPNATSQTLAVDQYNDAGSSFTVAATSEGCTETSAAVLVDSWVFLLPYVIHGGDEPYSYGPFGEPYYCEGDTATLTLGQPYTQNIVWTNNGIPIPGETSPVLTVTSTGAYSVSGAPEVCPDLISYLGMDVAITFTTNMQPDIVEDGSGGLCAYPTGNSTQWYLAGTPIATTDCITPDAPGSYTVFVDYGQPCQSPSEPWITTGLHGPTAPQAVVTPNPAGEQMTVTWPQGSARGAGWTLHDMVGRPVMQGQTPASGPLTLDVAALANGNYLLAPSGNHWRPIRVVVAH